MRIGVLGAGSIGTLFGSLLYTSGHHVTLYNRNRTTVKSIRQRGVRLVGTEGRRVLRIQADSPPRTLREFDLVLVTVKAYDTSAIARKYAGRLGTETSVLTLQNGLGNYEILARRLGSRVLVGSTSEAALTVKPGVIAHTGHGRTWIGEYDGSASDRSKRIVKAIRETGLAVSATDNILGVLWSKAIINSAINPVTALTRLSNGEIEQANGLGLLMESIVDEGVKVSRALQVMLQPSSPRKEMHRILRATAQNRSSMLQDVDRRARTEIEQLNGAIVKTARMHGIDARYNRLILGMVRALESSYLKNKHQ